MAQRGIVVVGLGRAGSARVRDIEASPDWRLVGVVSRRPGLATISWEDALSSTVIEAVAICTENATHEALVRAAIGAGKHVLVEYPLALSAGAAAGLCALADAGRRVLHVEEIGLLSQSHARTRERLVERGSLRAGELYFRGRYGGRSTDLSLSGFPAFAGVSRLCRLVDWFGELTLTSASLERDAESYRMEARLRTALGAPLAWVEERRKDAARSLRGRFELSGGVVEVPSGSTAGLFALDLALFTQKVSGGRPADEGRRRVLHCLEVAEAVERAARGEAV